MANVIILTQPQSVFVDEGTSSVTFSTSGTTLGTSLSNNPVVYQWYSEDASGGGFVALEGEVSADLTLDPIEAYDNDTFKAGLSAVGAEDEVFTNVVTFGIRLSSAKYKEWEVPGETGENRVRRLQVMGYL
jgi:hypothetical protein